MTKREKEEEEDEEGYICRRDFPTNYKAPLASKRPKIVFLGAPFAGRGI